jgi:hypothetical protein
MPEAARDRALELMTEQVKRFDVDELLEVHNELFPDEAYTQEEAHKDPGPLIKRLVDHIHSGRRRRRAASSGQRFSRPRRRGRRQRVNG